MRIILKSKTYFSEAEQWTGDNIDSLNLLASGNLTWSENEEGVADVQVWNKILQMHLPVRLNQFIVKGVEGELYVLTDSMIGAQFESSLAE